MRGVLASLACLLCAAPAWAADVAHPAVVELFQSQGCSSCPPANAHVMALIGRPDVLALSWQVTYWDYLGWHDSFDDPAYTARQRDYAAGLGHDEVFTPQVVVNGRADTVGTQDGEIEALLQRADRGNGGPSVAVSGNRVSIGQGEGRAEVVLVRYDPRIIQVAVLRGENGGLTLPHRNVVRQLRVLGRWTGQPATFQLPAPTHQGLKVAVLVQSGVGGPILAAGTD